jgi:hypothetical protein
MELAVRHAQDAVPPLKQAAPATPAALCTIVHRLLHKKAADRFQTAADLLEALNRVASLSPRERVGVRGLGHDGSLSPRERAGVRA